MKTLTEQFYSLYGKPNEQSEWLKKNGDSWMNELNEEIKKTDDRIKEAETRSIQFEAWVNLFKISPELALKNRHMGIIRMHQEQR